MRSPVVTVAAMRAAEEAAFDHGISAATLMDEAAAGIADAIGTFFPTPGRCLVFAGKGNNAGDAFAAAELLRQRGWDVELRLAFAETELGPLAHQKLNSLRRSGTSAAESRPEGPLIALDGLLGLGGTPPLRPPLRDACRALNALRREARAYIWALDLPTGLDGTTGAADPDCVVADFTVTIGFAKEGLLADRALDQVGRLVVVPLAPLTPPNESPTSLLTTAASLRHLFPPRQFGAYKNQFGRVGVVAGSEGLAGAAVLCSLGALRGGAGLVELFVPPDIYPIVAASNAPEVMVQPITSYRRLAEASVDVWAVGPGLGRSRADELLPFIAQAPQPMVLDADGLNILAANMETLRATTAPRLLTPHPGEMHRLFPRPNASRAEQAREFCATYSAALFLKGSRTIVAQRDQPLSYNTTGNPGMATGGMGDVLTGVCAALLAQKLSPYDAARAGAWLCGRAAEFAIFNGNASEQSLLASDVLCHLGAAFRELSR